ncbi:hypothetical protein N474_11435 [Pseudoalteromonas luteoviolacea CPMOR-2]|uniref:Uncharacterized protein n=1 Tax=Pseudoalteromonas luteoviolacea DSM 6061 TaxID=1365250 RepID=A0A166XXW6_9GAMM|nr:hypothetical protein N475_01200 [Pseudoalteromonas luteoviolacea DSM 6061]KZN56350.1 hypothetical protein N474_11435 [Pseudoalteromonas luteoviolacea CPMOR-2]MBE0386254.1 hypothetical protein [Pseudoalteromonas luteoviolacea DSM 6061]
MFIGFLFFALAGFLMLYGNEIGQAQINRLKLAFRLLFKHPVQGGA